MLAAMASQRTIVMLRFEEPPQSGGTAFTLPPVDEVGSLGQMAQRATPGESVEAPCGRGLFLTGIEGFTATDASVLGPTLLNRDMSVQAILSLDPDGNFHTNTVICRGAGGSLSERVTYALCLYLIDLPTRTFAVRLHWENSAGTPCPQLPAYFIGPATVDEFFMVTATRRWVSSTEVEVNYYINDVLVGETLNPMGAIGGGTTGTTHIGWNPQDEGYWGTIDELRLCNYVLCREEIEATWARIARHQEDGEAIVRGLFPPGMPITGDLTSSAQKDIRLIGQSLGQAIAATSNARENLGPDRAYGAALARWEQITGQAPGPADSILARRSRVISHLRQRAGYSVPGVTEALKAVLQTAPDQLEVLAFANIVEDSFATLEPERWWVEPSAEFSISGGKLRHQAAIGRDLREGIDPLFPTMTYHGAAFARFSVDDYRMTRVQAKLDPTGLAVGGLFGIRLFNWITDTWLFVGMYWNGVNYVIVSQSVVNGVSGGIIANNVLAGVPVAYWFHVGQSAAGSADYSCSYSSTHPTGYSTFITANALGGQEWHYADLISRSAVVLGAATDVLWDDFRITMPYGKRPFRAYVFRDPALPGTADVRAGHDIIQRMKHAHTAGTVITSRSLLCDDAGSVCDRGPMGAL